MDVPWKLLHIDYARPLIGSYYFIIEGSFSKWPEILKWFRLYQWISLMKYSQSSVFQKIISDNGTQFTAKDFA